MKFAKDLKESIIPEWAEHYIAYDKLKTTLRKCEENNKVREPHEHKEFHDSIDGEIAKVNGFYVRKLEEYNKLVKEASPERTNTSYSSEPPQKTSRKNYSNDVKMEQESMVIVNVHTKLGQLQSFVYYNKEGFERIMKKFDKRMLLRGTGKELGPAFEKRLSSEKFCNSDLDDALENARQSRLHFVPSDNMELKLIYGNSNQALSREVAARLGIAATHADIQRFNDGETSIQILESVRNTDVYILQPTCASVGATVNDNLMELLLLISAARRASASRVTAVVPYYGYARQDRKDRSRVPISAADVARMIEVMGADRVIAVDLHCAQIQGFFGPRTPVDNLFASPIAWSFFKTRNLKNLVIVSPDAGGVTRAKRFRDGMIALGVECNFAVIIKQRAQAGKIGSMDLVGNVKDSDCIIVDDMIDTAGTLCKAAGELRNFGAKRVFAFASHGLFNGPAAERIEASVLDEVIVSNTVPLRADITDTTKKIRQISVGKLIATAIRSIHDGWSLSALFDKDDAVTAEFLS